MYLVGGIVRDMLLGIPSKDHDFSVVLQPSTIDILDGNGMPDPFAVMRRNLESRGVEIFVETPEFLTIRGRFAKDDSEYPGIAADFVLARKDSNIAIDESGKITGSDGRRPDWVEPGTLEDDLARRDFTVNAMAMRADGSTVDLFDGRTDLAFRRLKFVGDPMTRIREDALRVMRAFRFCVTKEFWIEEESYKAIVTPETSELLAGISEDRRAAELSYMFRFDTEASLDILADIPRDLRAAMFAGRVRLDSTLKK